MRFTHSISGNQGDPPDSAGSARNSGVLRINENGITVVSGSLSVGVSYWAKAQTDSATFSITSVTPE